MPWKREIAYRRRFALVMGQKNQLWWDLPAMESFRLHQQIYRIEPAAFQATLDELSDLLEIGKLLRQPVRELSLGERMKMELTAALLHSPEVLFLDEPTIGLDVVAQHRIQQFLKHYQEQRQITILLTSHYMKDVAALCRRVVIIAQGQIKYDGSLTGIVDRFSGQKLITLQLADGQATEELSRFGHLVSIEPPKVKLRIERAARSPCPGRHPRPAHGRRRRSSKTRRWRRSSRRCSRACRTRNHGNRLRFAAYFIFMLIKNSAFVFVLPMRRDEQFHRVGRVHVGQHAAQDADAAVFFGVHQHFFAARAAAVDVDGRPDALIDQLAVEDESPGCRCL